MIDLHVLFQTYFAKKYFDFFDKDGSGTLEVGEFVESLKTLMSQTELEKLNFLFNIFDSDGKNNCYFMQYHIKTHILLGCL